MMARTAAPPAPGHFSNDSIDYAGTFPPAALPCGSAVANFAEYRTGPRAWMLRWLVVSAADLDHVPTDFDGTLSVLADADSPRAASIESKRIISAARPVYCEKAGHGPGSQ